MKVVKIEAGKKPYIKEIESNLESLQSEVEGYIECIYPWNDNACIICNEEGKINGMELNRALEDDDGCIFDIIAGPFLVVGITDDDFCSLSDEQTNQYQELFRMPELFVRINGKVHICRMN